MTPAVNAACALMGVAPRGRYWTVMVDRIEATGAES